VKDLLLIDGCRLCILGRSASVLAAFGIWARTSMKESKFRFAYNAESLYIRCNCNGILVLNNSYFLDVDITEVL
jgi:hypothetical protein